MRKTKKPKPHRSYWRPRNLLLLLIPLVVLCACVLGYVLQPAPRKQEIKRLVSVFRQSEQHVNLLDLVTDISSLFFGKGNATSAYSPDGTPLFGGQPVTMKERVPFKLLQNDAYWVGYDENRRTPAWVAYKLVDIAAHHEVKERPPAFLPDNRTLAGVTSDLYTNSGYDRGHLAPNHSIALHYGEAASQQTFLMSNIVPQRHTFNIGIWQALEKMERHTLTPRCQCIWVITGPIYPRNISHTLPSGLPVPEAFYKIIIDQVEGNFRVLPFIIPHTDRAEYPLAQCLVSINEIEEQTGIDFLPQLPESEQTVLEAVIPPKIW